METVTKGRGPLLGRMMGSMRAKWRRGERGQMIMVFALLIVPITFLLGAVAVDASVWQSERRGAHKDADLAALAGALELARKNPGDAERDAAEAAAGASAGVNDEVGNASVANLLVDDSCFGVWEYDAVTIDVRHASRTFFSSIFGLDVAPDIGAHAKACAGAAQAPNGLVPIQMDLTQEPCFEDSNDPGNEPEPQFGILCPIEYGSQQDNKDRGLLDLEASGDYCSEAGSSGDLEDLIEFGATGTCLINTGGDCDPNTKGPWYDCVAVQRGNPAKVARAFRDRIAREGACDADNNGYESFEETVNLVVDSSNPSERIYEARDCEPNIDGDQISPRLITIIVLEEPPLTPQGNTGYPIYAFAGYYVSGCADNPDITVESELDRFCDVPGNSSVPIGSSAEFVGLNLGRPCGHGNQPTCTPVPTNTPGGAAPTATPTPKGNNGGGGGGVGHIVVYGRFVNLIFAGHETGAPTEATTIFSISLVE
jgi:hypothetical protein